MEIRELADRESIRQTLARYTMAGDRGRIDELVACFTPDGVLEFEHEWVATGHGAIEQHVKAARDLTVAGASRRTRLRHHVSTQAIERVSPSEARAWSYFMAMTDAGPDHSGRYIDRLCRIGDAWLIQHRRVCVEWWSPATIYDEQATRAQSRRQGRGDSPG